MLGISKKTLVETEKGRRELSWTEVIAVVSVFEKSEVLQGIVGGEAGDVIHALALRTDISNIRRLWAVRSGGA